MKRIFTLLAAVGFASLSFGQSQRMVLVEEATNASCGPCASQNPAFHTLLEDNSDKVVSIMYQVWWPGFDPMYEDNTPDVDARIPYYPAIEGAPTAIIDGVAPTAATNGFDPAWYNGAPGGYSQTVIDDAYAVPASFDIDIVYDYNPDGINIEATATCTQDVSGNLALHVVVIEKHINWDSAPGSNGETSFYHVMKKMLPSPTGMAMASDYTVGETATSTQSWDLSTVYDMNEVAVVAFIQDNDTKEVLQAAMADDGVFEAVYSVDAAPVSNADVGVLCESVVNPMIEIRNNGSETLTSLDINYDINGTTGTVAWTGSLEFYETEMVELGDISFTDDGDNVVMITLANPNGATDENTGNDMIEFLAEVGEESTTLVTVEILTDNYPEETTWEFRDENDAVVASGGNYAGQANTNVSEEVQLGTLGCYSFEIFDTYGDGLNSAQWGGTDGTYSVTSSDGTVLISGGGADNWSSESTKFTATSVASAIEDVVAENSFNLFPNPSATGLVNVQLELLTAQKVSIDIYDMVGKKVEAVDFGTMSAGQTIQELNVENLNSGIYLMNINVGDESITTKFVLKN